MRELRTIEIYDTTLRDGSQGEGISFTTADKIQIALKLDAFGVDYIEGGWPMNPKDAAFFEEIRKHRLHHAKITVFGSTRRKDNPPEKDANLLSLVQAKPDVFTIFGKSWDFHVRDALRCTLEENLQMIADSVQFLHRRAPVFYDAEHFFDGYKANAEYAVKTIRAAADAGAERIILCDTNGGTLPAEIEKIVVEVRNAVAVPIGIHTHNDSELAVANSLAAVMVGAEQVQGTINGIGERTGNANLCSVMAILGLKMRKDFYARKNLSNLTALSRFVSETANLPVRDAQPFTGASAFMHKGGVHVSAVERNPATYEHIEPEVVGNQRRFVISELGGGATLRAKGKKFGLDTDKLLNRKALERIQELESQGYQFEGAEASFEILIKTLLGQHQRFFELSEWRTIVEKRAHDASPLSEATIKLRVGERIFHTVADGDGPVNALDGALRRALEQEFPVLKRVKLVDFKVRVVNGADGTAAGVRVIIEWQDGDLIYSTVGVSENIIEASWRAMVDGVEYRLMKDEEEKKKKRVRVARTMARKT